jgi:stage III sporulation protein SpoIIIAA
MTQKRITDDLHALLGVLPAELAEAVIRANNSDNLLEIILDLGRQPVARFVGLELPLSEKEIARDEIDFVVAHIGEFDADNRAGLERTLHRISAIRNRRGHIVGLTCRVGRAVYGTIDIIQDLIESEKSILLLGKPGIGKTTMLREVARMLAEKKRVIIVDTSNEIGGDGDVPHPAVGRARRMQVRMPNLQHEVMIEAVENHNPEVIVIDEIGRALEAEAARTIAERGVQLVATAHGRTLENLLLNPTLSDLIGGIESVTLSDEEARRRGTQKTVLERRAPPTFDILVEIQERDRLVIYADVAAAVDELVRGFPLHPEIRSRDAEGKIRIEKAATIAAVRRQTPQGQRRQLTGDSEPVAAALTEDKSANPRHALKPVRIFAYGVARNRLVQASKRLGVPVVLVRESGEADALMTLRTYYRSHQQTIQDAENRGTPIYVLRANTVSQMEQSMAEMFNLEQMLPSELDLDQVSLQTQEAIETVLNGQRFADLPPAAAAVRRLQHDQARQAQLISHSYGKEPHRYVRIFRE